MRIASFLQLRPRAKVRPGVAGRGLLPVVLLAGCFFELEELAVNIGGFGGGIGGSMTAGGAGAGQGGSPNGGGAGGDTVGPCPSGQKLCGDQQCRPIAVEFGCGDTTTCQPCVAPNTAVNATVACNSDSGECFVSGCAAGFADCDGDVINDVGQISGNGCEYSFGDVRASTEVLDVPEATVTITLDGDRQDWSAVPAYAFTELCANCSRTDLLTEVTNESTLPGSRDLDAYFRVAWDKDFFYVLGEAFDNHVFDAVPPGQDCRAEGEACEDGFSVFFDGRNDRELNTFDTDDHFVFMGLSERFVAPGQGPPEGSDVAVKSAPVGTACYRVEAQFDWAYVTGTKNGAQAPPGVFPPAATQKYGFTISVNDWDPAISDPSQIERQSQVFWISPGEGYRFTAAYGTVELSGALEAGIP